MLSKDPPIHRKKVVAAPNPSAAAKHHQQQLMQQQHAKAKVIVAPSNNTQQSAQAPPPPVPRRKHSLSASLDNSLLIASVKVMSIQHDQSTNSETFCIRLTRKSSISAAVNTIIINRSIPDFIALAGAAGCVFKTLNQEIYPLSHPSREAKQKAMEMYLTRLSMHLLPNLPASAASSEETKALLKAASLFFAPRSDMETFAGQASTLRRDSGADADDGAPDSRLDNEKMGLQQQQQHQVKSNPFASFSKMVFGTSSSSSNLPSMTAST